MKKSYTMFALIGGDTTIKESGHITEDEMREAIKMEFPHLEENKLLNERLLKLENKEIIK